MLRSCGFAVTAHLGHEIYLCEPDGSERSGGGDEWRRAELLAATGRPWRQARDQA